MTQPGRTAGLTRERTVGLLPETLSSPACLPWIAVLGLLFRLGLLQAARHNAVFPDELDYQAIGVALWKAHSFALAGLPTAYRAPGEPLFIAGMYQLFGEHPFLIKLAQVFLLTSLPFLCARLARMLGLGMGGSYLSAFFASFHPALAYAATTLYPTALTAVALTAGVVYCTSAYVTGKRWDSAKAGLALGVAGCATTTLAALPLLAAVFFLFKKRVRIALVIGILGLLPALGWLARNRVAMGAWVLATNTGVNLQLGANDAATPRSGNWVVLPTVAGGELVEDRVREQAALAWIRLHPVRYGGLVAGRALLIVDSVGRPRTEGLHSGLAARLAGWAMLPLALLGFAGMVLYRRTPAAWLTGVALASIVASSAITLAKPRFRFPCDPLLGTFAAASLAHLWRKVDIDRGDSSGPTPAPR